MSNSQNHNFAQPPFQLRPNKYVDRMLFIELIGRVIGKHGSQSYTYISMGAKFLHDHNTIYRRLGIDKLVSFDRNEDGVKRQKFNRPTDKMKCLPMDSSELASSIDDLRRAENVVVWLDYMSSSERRIQLEETTDILSRLLPGDLFRVTLNSDYRSFGRYGKDEKKKYKSAQEMVASKLKTQIGDYLPHDLETIEASELPAVLANAVGIAAEQALLRQSDISILPVMATTYADNARMLTVACIVLDYPAKQLPPNLRRWKFRSKNWADVQEIRVPDLSVREKLHIDKRLTRSPKEILRSLKFEPEDIDEKDELIRAIKSYKRLHRFYPAFHNIDY